MLSAEEYISRNEKDTVEKDIQRNIPKFLLFATTSLRQKESFEDEFKFRFRCGSVSLDLKISNNMKVYRKVMILQMKVQIILEVFYEH